MFEQIANFQSTIFEMSMNGLITDREFSILESLSDNMTKDSDALELATTLTMQDLSDPDVVDSILAKEFTTAMMIIY